MKYQLFDTYKALLASTLLAFLSLSACQNEATNLPSKAEKASWISEIDTTCEIGYWVLDLEAAAGLGVKIGEYRFLDDFLNELSDQPQLQPKSTYTRQEALERLRWIDAAIAQRRVDGISYHNTFSICLRYKMFDCDINSLLFLSAAERLGLPIVAIAMPNHVSILWDDGEQKIYWETTESRTYSLDFYRNRYQIEAEDVGKSMLLEPLNRQQLLGIAFFNIGKTYSEMKNYDAALHFTQQALYFSHNWFEPYKSIAHIYEYLQRPADALDYAKQALRLSPHASDTYAIIARAYTQLGCNTEAIAAYQRYLRLLPNSTYNYTTMLEDIKGQIKLLDL